MALIVDTTKSGQYSNSYITSDWADDYWSNHYDTVKAAQWAALSDDQKNYLLIMACRVIETVRVTVLVPLKGDYNLLYDMHTHTVLDINLTQLPVKYYYFQMLQFPRNLDRDTVTGVSYIPPAAMMAQAEQAVYLLNYDDGYQSLRMQGVVEELVRVGHIYSRHNFTSDGSAFCPMALEFLRPYVMKASTQMRRA